MENDTSNPSENNFQNNFSTGVSRNGLKEFCENVVLDIENTNNLDEQIIKEMENLAEIISEDFIKKIFNEKDISVIILKSHLFIEYYLNCIIVLVRENCRVDDKSFKEKVNILNDSGIFNKTLVIACLKNLNKIRNNLAHELDHKLFVSEIDGIGFTLGKEYIFKKFEKKYNTDEEIKELFFWAIAKALPIVLKPFFREIAKYKVQKKLNKV